MDWYSMNSNQSVYELHETSLNLRPDDLPGHWQARRVVSQDAVWKLKHKGLRHTLWRTSSGRGHGTAVRQTT
jgi:hypothetical protein